MNDTVRVDKEDFGILAVCAIRYCQGRESYMPELVRRILRPYLKDLSDKDIQVMIKDCENQEFMGTYGSPWVDKPGWMEWKEVLLKEKKDRDEWSGKGPF